MARVALSRFFEDKMCRFTVVKRGEQICESRGDHELVDKSTQDTTRHHYTWKVIGTVGCICKNDYTSFSVLNYNHLHQVGL